MGACHKDNPLVFEANGVKVYAGGRNRGGGWHTMEPMPDLAMGPIGVINSAKKRDVLPLGWNITDTVNAGPTPTVMEIDWPDMGVPNNLHKEFWKALTVDIKVKGIKSISTMCAGGHGRTGVQLAILAHFLIEKKYHEWKTAEELILWVRKQYCDNAVESTIQQLYISEVCDIPEGDSAIVLTHTPWSNDFSASAMFTESEIEQQVRQQERIDAEKKSKPKRKAIEGVEWVSKHSTFVEEEAVYDTPVVDNYSLTKCDTCGDYEWRNAREEWMLLPCLKCDGNAVYPADNEIINEENQVQCFQTGEMWHEIEMYDPHNHISFWAEAKKRNMKTREGKRGVLEIMPDGGHRYQPTHFLIREGDDILAAAEIHKRKNEIVKRMRKEEREARSKLDEHSSVDSIYDYEEHSPNTQDKAVDMLRKKRQTNEEIESED